MNNFLLRLFSSFFLIIITINVLFHGNLVFYFCIAIMCFFSFYEIYANVKQKILSFFLYILIIFFIFSLIHLRGNDFNGFVRCLWVVSLVSFSDIGGYVFGKIIKGPKLSKISPNKTISGLIGSLLFSQISILIPIFLLNNFEINLTLILLQILVCLLAITGDIFFSYIKRINNIKDYSNLIPGHGGILDRIDGMIFGVIFYNLFIKIFNV